MIRREKHSKKFFARRALGFGIGCVFSALYFFAPTLFTFEGSLLEKNGKVNFVKTFYSKVSSRGHESIKSILIIKLHNDNRIYRIAKNIDQSWRNEKFELIEKELKKSKDAIVWIKKSDISELEPEVFQIATGNRLMLYEMDDVKSELRYLFPLILIIGIFNIGFFLHHQYPDRIKKLLRNTPAHNSA